jgi:hypothetical protein
VLFNRRRYAGEPLTPGSLSKSPASSLTSLLWSPREEAPSGPSWGLRRMTMMCKERNVAALRRRSVSYVLRVNIMMLNYCCSCCYDMILPLIRTWAYP